MVTEDTLEKIAAGLAGAALEGDVEAARTLLSYERWFATGGVLTGLPPEEDPPTRTGQTPPAVARLIVTLREEHGLSYPRIARKLNEDGVPTAAGGREWYPPVVRSVYLRHRGMS